MPPPQYLPVVQSHATLPSTRLDPAAHPAGKINYMDPRITVAWCKRVQLPLERVFAKTLQSKFPWACGSPSTFKF